MKYMLFILSLLLHPKAGQAQYKPVDQGSQVTFRIGNFGFDVNGSFAGGLQGVIAFDPQNIGGTGPQGAGGASFDVTIDASTINTDNKMRDSHLRDDGFFDVKNYPRIRLVSTKLTATNKRGVYQFTGQLTIKGKSKEVSFPFTAVAGSDGYVFSGSFKINRKDFGVGGTSTISNELTVSLNIVTVKS
jgi:polyisoprenoid-binding protein YceI